MQSIQTLIKTKHCKICNKDINITNFSKHCKTRKHLLLSGEEVPEKLLKSSIINCECGSVVKRTSLTNHYNTRKHSHYIFYKYMESKKN